MRVTYEKTVPEFNRIRGKFKMTYYYSCADCNCEVKYYKILPDKVEPRCATCRANRKKAARIALRQAEDEELKRKAVEEFAEWLEKKDLLTLWHGDDDNETLSAEKVLKMYEKEARK